MGEETVAGRGPADHRNAWEWGFLGKRSKGRRGKARPVEVSPGWTWPSGLRWNFGLLGLASVLLYHPIFLHPTRLLWASDIVRLHVTCKAVQARSLWAWHAFPLWDPTLFCGKSIVGDPIPAVLNPLAWLFWVVHLRACGG